MDKVTEEFIAAVEQTYPGSAHQQLGFLEGWLTGQSWTNEELRNAMTEQTAKLRERIAKKAAAITHEA